METRSTTSSLGYHTLHHPRPRRLLPRLKRNSSLDCVQRFRLYNDSCQPINFSNNKTFKYNSIQNLFIKSDDPVFNLNNNSNINVKDQNMNREKSSSISRLRHQTLPFGVSKDDLNSVSSRQNTTESAQKMLSNHNLKETIKRAANERVCVLR